MTYVVTLENYQPGARYDGQAWTQARIDEAPDLNGAPGAFTTIDTQQPAPVDSDPTHPSERSFTTKNATLEAGWYRVTFLDPDGHAQATDPRRSPSLDPAQIVSLADTKDYLDIPADDTRHDNRLRICINAVRPLIENITGPIIPTVFEEWHNGGQHFIRLRRRPSTALGTSPILDLIGCDEYRGPIKYPLTIVADPSEGTIYSCMLDTHGTVVRRSPGGGVIAFPPMPDSVHVIYRAGQQTVPANVYEGALELVRVNYQTTQQVGRGRLTVADEQDTGQPALGFYIPRRVRELLAPSRRAPSIA